VKPSILLNSSQIILSYCKSTEIIKIEDIWFCLQQETDTDKKSTNFNAEPFLPLLLDIIEMCPVDET
jgi:hypothetical protein